MSVSDRSYWYRLIIKHGTPLFFADHISALAWTKVSTLSERQQCCLYWAAILVFAKRNRESGCDENNFCLGMAHTSSKGWRYEYKILYHCPREPWISSLSMYPASSCGLRRRYPRFSKDHQQTGLIKFSAYDILLMSPVSLSILDITSSLLERLITLWVLYGSVILK